MRNSTVPLRLQPSLLEEAKKVAATEGVALNHLVNVAVAEKLSAIRTAEFFRERAANADSARAIEILTRLGHGKPPMPGDELVED